LRDISVGGARLRFETKPQVPRQFRLQMPRGGRVQLQCEVVWQDDSDMGVRFLAIPSLPRRRAKEPAPEVTYL